MPWKDDETIHYCPIPATNYIIRLYDGGMERQNLYMLDFLDRVDRSCVAPPPGAMLSIVKIDGPPAPILLGPQISIQERDREILRREFDIKQFLVPEGGTCKLDFDVGGREPFKFKVPKRPRPDDNDPNVAIFVTTLD